MAALSLFRFSQNSGFRNYKATQYVLNNIARKQVFSTTAIHEKRIYGPTEPGTMPPVTSHWKMERYVAAALVPLIPLALVAPNIAFDMSLTAVMVLHCHWGLYGIFTDYIHGEYIRPIGAPLVIIMSVLAFAGLCMLNINDIGFSRAVHKIYTEL